MEQVRIDIAVLKTKFDNAKAEIEEKHRQNRLSIHEVRDAMQDLVHELATLKLKIAFYSGAAGVITAGVIKLLDHIWK